LLAYRLLAAALALGALDAALPAPASAAPPPSCRDHARGTALLLGDSNMYGSFGHALTRWFRYLGYDSVTMRGKPSSGLARPDFFDWALEGGRLVRQHRPEVVVIILGGNDVQRMRAKNGLYRDGIAWADEAAWIRTYRARLRELLTALTDGDPARRVFLLSPTNRRSKFLRQRVQRIVAVQREVAAEVAGVTWIDTYGLSSDGGGRYLAWGRDDRGLRVPMRRHDGIHLTKPGANDLAARVVGGLLPLLDRSGCAH
jgi:hypothetical protein